MRTPTHSEQLPILVQRSLSAETVIAHTNTARATEPIKRIARMSPSFELAGCTNFHLGIATSDDAFSFRRGPMIHFSVFFWSSEASTGFNFESLSYIL